MSSFQEENAFEESPRDRIQLYAHLSTVEEEGDENSAPPQPKPTRSVVEDTISLDSTSLIGGLHHGSQNWWNHQKIQDNWKIVLASFCLLFIGLGLILVGIVFFCLPSPKVVQGIIFLVTGIICFTPGAYHIIYAYLAAKGKRGYDFRHLPLFN